MGCRIMVGREDGTEREMAVMFDSVTGWAFGPTFHSGEMAMAFARWVESAGTDPRVLTDAGLRRDHREFREWLNVIRGTIFTDRPELDSDDGETVVCNFGHGVMVEAQVVGGNIHVEQVTRLWQGRRLQIGPLFEDGDSPTWPTVFDRAEEIIRKLR